MEMYAGASAPVAARRVVRGRMSPGRSTTTVVEAGDTNGDDEPDEAAWSLLLVLKSRHLFVHTVVFALGVLPQAIKLFSMRGIPWTQACGGLYLSSFFVVAGVGVLASCAPGGTRSALDERTLGVTLEQLGVIRTNRWVWPGRRSRVRAALDENTLGDFLGLVGVVTQLGIWVGCSWVLLHPVWTTYQLSAPLFTEMMTWLLILIWIFLVFGVVKSLTDAISSFVSDTFAVHLLAGLVVILGPMFTILYSTDVTAILLGVFIAIFTILRVSPYYRMVSFGLANLAFSILYYRFRYDPIGTIKSPWADYLG